MIRIKTASDEWNNREPIKRIVIWFIGGQPGQNKLFEPYCINTESQKQIDSEIGPWSGMEVR